MDWHYRHNFIFIIFLPRSIQEQTTGQSEQDTLKYLAKNWHINPVELRSVLGVICSAISSSYN
jgi:hypothetical protein